MTAQRRKPPAWLVKRHQPGVTPWRDDPRLSDDAKAVMDFVMEQAPPGGGPLAVDDALVAKFAARFGMSVDEARNVLEGDL